MANPSPVGIDDLRQQLIEEIPVWGHLPARMRFKQAVVGRFGVEHAFALAAPDLETPGLDRLHCRRIRSLAEFVRTEALSYRELWPGGAVVDLPMPRVIGAGDQRPTLCTERAAYLACVDQVLVRGRSDILLRGDEALLDFEGDEFARVHDNPEYDPAVLASSPRALWTMEPAGDVPRLDEALMLCGAHAKDFGHWLMELLPKLASARLAGWRGGMPVLVDQSIPGTIRKALTALLPADAPLHPVPVAAPLRVDRLWCMANASYPGFHPGAATTAADADGLLLPAPARFATLIREVRAMTDAATTAPTGVDRLLLARRPERKKRLLNHPEIEALLTRHGFHAVYPEDLSFFEQLRLVRHARCIVAPEGSNGLLSLFASPAAAVCILGPPATQMMTSLTATLAQLAIDALLFTGPAATDAPDFTDHPYWSFWNDYRIDARALEGFLQRWLK